MPARAPSGHLQRISVSVNQCHLLLQNPPGHPAVHARAVRRLQSSDVHTNHQARVPEYYPSPIPPGPAAIPPSLRPSSNTIDTCTFVHTHQQVCTHARNNIIYICTTAVRSTQHSVRRSPWHDASPPASTPRRNIDHCTTRASSEAAKHRTTAPHDDSTTPHHTTSIHKKEKKKREKKRQKKSTDIIYYIHAACTSRPERRTPTPMPSR